MSTKIWTAWRFPQKHLNEFLDCVRPQMFSQVVKDVETMAESVKPEAIAEQMASWSEKSPFSREDTEFGRRVELTLKTWADPRMRESLLAFDCGLNVWFYRGQAYVIPWGHPKYADCLELPSWAEEYAYWNNTDRPDNLTQRQWDARARTWNRAALDHWSTRRLVFNVVDMEPLSMSRSEIELHFLRRAATQQPGSADGVE